MCENSLYKKFSIYETIHILEKKSLEKGKTHTYMEKCPYEVNTYGVAHIHIHLLLCRPVV